MGGEIAIRAAVKLLHVPSRVRVVRMEPLPAGVALLLRIAAGEAGAEETAIAATGRSRDLVKQAAIFFIEQVLLHPDSDSYRVLGVAPQANNSELRLNMALLLRWLHPDRAPPGQYLVYVSRVTRAWDDLKTPERRARYDEGRRVSAEPKKASRRRASKLAAAGKRALALPRRKQQRVSVPHRSHSLLRQAWLFLISVTRP